MLSFLRKKKIYVLKVFKLKSARGGGLPRTPPTHTHTGMGITIDHLSANLGPLTLKFAIMSMSQSSNLYLWRAFISDFSCK